LAPGRGAGSDGFFSGTLWELDPDTGAVRDFDPIFGMGPFTGLATLWGNVYILDEGENSIMEFNPAVDIVMNVFDMDILNPGLILMGGLSGASAPDAILAVNAISSEIVEINPMSGVATPLFMPMGPPPLGVAVIDGVIYEGGAGGPVETYTRFGMFLGPFFPAVPVTALGGDDAPPPTASDWFSFAVSASDNLTISTSTPADGGGEFVNSFNPALELYDPSGTLVASDDDNGPDGRNAYLTCSAAETGVYTARVLEAGWTSGEYVLTIAGATGGLAPFNVTSTVPADGALIGVAPSQIVVDFDDTVFIPSLAASDLTVDDVGAAGFTVIDGDTVAFDLPALADGVHDVEILAGEIVDLQGALVALHAGTFTLDTTPPGDVTGLTLTPSDGRIDLAWTNPPDADFAGVLVLRRLGSSPSGTPSDITSYTAGDFIGDGQVVYVGVGSSGTPGAVSDWQDDTVAGGTYHYAVFAFDALPHYSAGVADSAMCGTIIYVDGSATGGNNGGSWDDAFTSLQTALTAAVAGNQIWVAQGTHRPAGGRTDEFQLVTQVSLYGGFEGLTGQEGNFALRDWVAYPTVLSGDIGVGGDDTDNTYHVLIGANYAVLDGFTVTGGNADGSYPDYYGGGAYLPSTSGLTIANCTFTGNSADYGGGIRNSWATGLTIADCTFTNNSANYGGGVYSSSATGLTIADCTFTNNSVSRGGGLYSSVVTGFTIADCTFTGNVASSWGGGVYNSGSSPVISGCTFTGNQGSNGGGILNTNNSAPSIVNCTFTGNDAASGGAIQNKSCSPTVTDCDFIANTGGFCGGLKFEGLCASAVSRCTFVANTANVGAALDAWQPTCTPVVSNCLFVGNVTTGPGGAVRADGSMPTFLNCTFSANEATQGGAVHSRNSASPTFTNCILWGNLATVDSPNFYLEAPGAVDVTHSCVEGGWAGTGNIGALPEHDPRFVDPLGPDATPGTVDDDLRLRSGSPCIDSADGDAAPGTDLDGNPRHDDSGVVDTGVGAITYADMGAYEFQGESVRILMVTPGVGPIAGGTVVTITGLNFVIATEVFFDATPAASVTFVSPTIITAGVPSSSTYGPVDVRVVNPDGAEDTAPNGFTYMGGPGDLDGDGDVDWDDVAIIMANAGLNSSHASWDPRCDPDGNNVCNLDDLMTVFRNFGNDYS
jgi:hypothetical protein